MTRDILRAADFSRADIEKLYARRDEPQPTLTGKTIVLALHSSRGQPDLAEIIQFLGAQVKTLTHNESRLSDLAREIDALNVDAVVFNHPEANAAQTVAEIVRAPLLNAGDGANENPVRALMDLYAIKKEKGKVNGLRIALLGNLKFGAEAHSLARLLSLFDLRLSLVSPAALSMPYDLTDDLRANGIEVEETNDLPTTLRKTDVLYLSRLDPARVEAKVYEKTKNFYSLTPAFFADAKPGLFVLGEWEGAEEVLAPSRAQWEETSRAMWGALLQYATT